VPKITFRADDDLVDRVEGLDTSKSEVMREALRAYLDEHESGGQSAGADGSIDALVAERVDELVAERLGGSRDVNVNITLDAGDARVESEERPAGATDETRQVSDASSADTSRDEHTCPQCGETLSDGHVYCPNCGEKAANRLFCDCGDELRSDWAFCPSCGRRTPSADVLNG
jgi:hypothetical protein